MFKIKFDPAGKEKIKQTLKIEESPDYEIVLCRYNADSEEGKVNLVFDLNQLDLLVDWLERYKKATGGILSGKTARGEVRVRFDQVFTIESYGNDVFAYTDKAEISLSAKLYQLEEELLQAGFFRISKSVIVNVARVEAIASGFNGKLTLIMDNKKKIEVNRSYTKSFKEYLSSKEG
ncbi:MAG: LytTR family DNA-binding domain-containing protein [Erysipelotrichaceae bacterium]|nr:LytTR family DNA-binding domain-containing protein [Erysipelotrichaceae bacterium]MDP3306118.1 LytTR family DNA-binding domain-containing protein [Erysipelotrichaceae bacterium]